MAVREWHVRRFIRESVETLRPGRIGTPAKEVHMPSMTSRALNSAPLEEDIHPQAPATGGQPAPEEAELQVPEPERQAVDVRWIPFIPATLAVALILSALAIFWCLASAVK